MALESRGKELTLPQLRLGMHSMQSSAKLSNLRQSIHRVAAKALQMEGEMIRLNNGSKLGKQLSVGLFVPCYIDMMFPEVGIATLQLLERFGLSVRYPMNQTCCGQPMSNSGDQANAAAAELLFVKNFAEFDYIVGPAGSRNAPVPSDPRKSRTFRKRGCTSIGVAV